MKAKKLAMVAGVVASLGLLILVSLIKADNLSIQTSVTQSSGVFKDTLPSWASDSIIKLNSAGIIKGYSNGKFGPADTLMRAQVTTMLYRTLKYKNIIQDPDSTKCNYYKDVKETDYYYLPACFLVLRSGSAPTVPNGDLTLSPNTEVPRGEAAGLIDLILGDTIFKTTKATRGTTVVFQDVPRSNAYFDSVGLVNQSGLMTGKSAGIFAPDVLLNRAEMAVVMDRTLNLLETLKIKKLAKLINKEAYMTECADLISQQATTCSAYQNFLVDIQVLKQNTKTKKDEIAIDQMVYGEGNRCDSSQAGDTIPAEIKSKFLDNQEEGEGKNIQVLCKVTCMGWNSCPGDEPSTTHANTQTQTHTSTPEPEATPEPVSVDHAYNVAINVTGTEHTECGSDCVGYISDATATSTITLDNMLISAGTLSANKDTSAPFTYSCHSTASGGKSGSLNETLNGYSFGIRLSDAPANELIVRYFAGPNYTYFQNTCEGTAQDPKFLIGKALEKAFNSGGDLYNRAFNINGGTASFSGRDHDAAISNDVSYFEYSGTVTVTPR